MKENLNDEIKEAINGISIFCANWCLDKEKTKYSDEPVFRCKKCVFEFQKKFCLIKMWAGEFNAIHEIEGMKR